jgi:tRNA threonylcarbamoyladenosine biosynthesis protein TsaB
MNLLALDTSGSACVIGIRTDQSTHVHAEIVDRSHSKILLPRIKSLMEQASLAFSDLDYIIYGKGPGSFTGLRIAVGVTQGLGYGLGIPVVPVSTMACVAQRVYREHGHRNIAVALHARVDEVFFSTYVVNDEGLVVLVEQEGVRQLHALGIDWQRDAWQDYVGVGSGWIHESAAQLDTIPATIIGLDTLAADDLLDLGTYAIGQGQAVVAVDARPEYLRETVASVPKPVSLG